MVLFNNKRGGGITEGIFVMIILFIAAIIWGSSVYLFNDIKGDVQEDLQSEQANETFTNLIEQTPSNLDSTYVVILALFWIGAIILAVFVDTHPIMFVISVISLVVILALAGVLANTYDDYQSDLGDLGTTLPKIHFIMTHMVEFIIGITATVLIALFAKNSFG